MALLIALSMGAVAAAPVGLFTLYHMLPGSEAATDAGPAQSLADTLEVGHSASSGPAQRPVSANVLALGEKRAALLRDRDHLGCTFDYEPPEPDLALSVAHQDELGSPASPGDPREPDITQSPEPATPHLLPLPAPSADDVIESGTPALRADLVGVAPLRLPAPGRATRPAAGHSGAALIVTDPFSGLPLSVASTATAVSGAATAASAQPAATTADAESAESPVTLTPLRISDGDVHGGTDPVIGGLILEGTGRLVPGHSPGIMPILSGDYVMDAGVLEIEIGGTALGAFDRIEVLGGGEARLSGGEIQISFIDGFTPAVGDTFEFLFASSGVIDDADFGLDEVTVSVTGLEPGLDFMINSDGGFGLELEIVAGAVAALTSTASASTATAPAPGTWLLMCAGLAGVFAGGRRRIRA
ncbi:MAG: PEP-CTERM sorting domain-containing protein [Pseudomonadota bacterium]